MFDLNYLLIVGSILILLSVVIARLSQNLGVPTFLLFIGLGMLAGSEGIGQIHFSDPALAQTIGIIALIFILFSGGLDTSWGSVRKVWGSGASLATLGVFLTCGVIGLFAHVALGFPLLQSLLIGAIISSTDAAAVFSVLRGRNLHLHPRVRSVLELESGSNDPMAIFLTLAVIAAILTPDGPWWMMGRMFVQQIGLGGLIGLALGKGMILFLNRIRFSYDGMYPVFALAFAGLVYSLTDVLGGSGFLAVYFAGLVVGNGTVAHKRAIQRFFDGLAWLGQIGMFLILGLLVFPSQLFGVLGAGLWISAALILIARPLGVFLSLYFSKWTLREKGFISWVGLRGAVPIILATFPLLAGLPEADLVFNIVFFIVLTSTLIQGWSIAPVARWFGVTIPPGRDSDSTLEFNAPEGAQMEIMEFILPFGAEAAGKSVLELGLPDDLLIVLVCRGEKFIVPSGRTYLEEGDIIQVLANKDNLQPVVQAFQRQKAAPPAN